LQRLVCDHHMAILAGIVILLSVAHLSVIFYSSFYNSPFPFAPNCSSDDSGGILLISTSRNQGSRTWVRQIGDWGRFVVALSRVHCWVALCRSRAGKAREEAKIMRLFPGRSLAVRGLLVVGFWRYPEICVHRRFLIRSLPACELIWQRACVSLTILGLISLMDTI